MLLVDTNVLVDVLEDDPQWADWSIQQLRFQSKIHRLVINPIVYSELSLTFSTVEALDETLASLGTAMIEIPRSALFLAGKAFVRYRRQGGTKSNVLGDFFIGAHAAVSGLQILTRDTQRYRTYFPSVVLIAPQPVM
jgi:predicted nucleic acid-binding protein